MSNTLYYGDNLPILRDYVPDESVDLVYLDPPFNSNASYNVLFKEQTGEASPAQIQAFTDTWEWGLEAERTYRQEIVENPRTPPAVVEMVSAFRQFVGANAMMAYLVMMAPRLVELRRALKPTGAIYLHCDPTASHYLKLLMDAVFGKENYRNEITWKRTPTVKGNFGQGSKLWGQATDTLLFYTKNDDYVFNQPFGPYSKEYIEKSYRYVEPETGRRYRLVSMIGPGGAAKGNPQYEVMGVTRYWRYSKARMQRLIDLGLIVQSKPGAVPHRKYYLDEGRGVPIQSLWDDIGNLQASAAERLGYPTQKPQALLERIIQASSNPGDMVLDPFCGCGTAVVAAHRLDRRWIGIDVTHLAVALMKNRLKTAFDLLPGRDYRVVGEPVDVGSARALAEQGPLPVPVLGHVIAGGVAARAGEEGRGPGHRRRRVLHRRPTADDAEGHRAGEERAGVVAARTGLEGHARPGEGGVGPVHHLGRADQGHAGGGRDCGLLPLGRVAAGLPAGADSYRGGAAGGGGVRGAAPSVHVPGGAA